MLPELVYAYTVTPHASTGFSPYYLFFGREPRLPVDEMLKIDAAEIPLGTDWVTEHQQRLQDAFSLASERLEREAVKRAAKHNKGSQEHPLQLGDRVFLRNRVVGRHKIQDHWQSVPHKVISHNVYVVEPMEGSKEQKSCHRQDLLNARDLVTDVEPASSLEESQETASELRPGTEADSEDNDSPDYTIVLDAPQADAPEDIADVVNFEDEGTADGTAGEPDEKPGTNGQDSEARRSQRANAGHHSNPHRLPRSAAAHECIAERHADRPKRHTLEDMVKTQLLLEKMLANLNPDTCN